MNKTSRLKKINNTFGHCKSSDDLSIAIHNMWIKVVDDMAKNYRNIIFFWRFETSTSKPQTFRLMRLRWFLEMLIFILKLNSLCGCVNLFDRRYFLLYVFFSHGGK